MGNRKNNIEIPIWHKMNLTIEEAAVYSNIGVNAITELINQPDCDFVLYRGSKRLIKREKFEEYISRIKSF